MNPQGLHSVSVKKGKSAMVVRLQAHQVRGQYPSGSRYIVKKIKINNHSNFSSIHNSSQNWIYIYLAICVYKYIYRERERDIYRDR